MDAATTKSTLMLPDDDSLVATEQLAGITLEEFLALPEVKPALEYEVGRVIQKVPPQPHHSCLQYQLCALFNQAGEARRTALAFPEFRASQQERSYVPDVSVYVWDRIPRSADGELAGRFDEFASLRLD